MKNNNLISINSFKYNNNFKTSRQRNLERTINRINNQNK